MSTTQGTTTDDTFVPLPGEVYEVEIVYPEFHDGNGFCYEGNCPCKEDQESIERLGQAIEDGEVTVEEADNIYHGRTVW